MSLYELHTEDIRGLERLEREIRRVHDWRDIGPVLAGGLRELIPSEYCIYNETDIGGSQFTSQYITEHIEPHHALLPRFYRHLGDHPIVANLGFEGLFSEVCQITDFCSMREYYQTGLYTEFYRHIGVDQQILTGFGIFGGVPVICCTHRKRKPFTAREKQIMLALKSAMVPVLTRKAAEQHARTELTTLLGHIGKETGLDGFENLTLTELTVAGHLLRGDTYHAIAGKLNRSPRTIEKHVSAILRKLLIENRYQLEASFNRLKNT